MTADNTFGPRAYTPLELRWIAAQARRLEDEVTTTEPSPARTAVRLARENQRLRAELDEVRKTSRQRIRDLELQIRSMHPAGSLEAAREEIRHLRDELTALRMEADEW